MTMKHCIDVSPEMQAFVGTGGIATDGWPRDVVGMRFQIDAATFAFECQPDPVTLADSDLAFVVTAEACQRIFGFVPTIDACWHLPGELRLIATTILDRPVSSPARQTLQLAKCIELLCTTFVNIEAATLTLASAAGHLSEIDARRIIAARQLIDERWSEKLTLDSIARACGINRAKLARGFRSMFAMSVGDALVERRLGGASTMLRSTDLPISSIGYRCGYLNNASFTRAFSRRFGLAPTHYRAHRSAA